MYYFLLASLLESADKVANTASVYGAYLKHLKKTALQPLVIEPAFFEENDNTHEVYNEDSNTHGILVELPLPKHISKEQVMLTIHHHKDVDGISPINRGFLLGGQEDLALIPATPMSCIELMERAGVTIRGKRVVLVGRGDTVGRPLASLLIKRDATITVCHTKTVDLPSVTQQAEVLVAAAGRKGLVTGDMVSEGTVVIDAGINQVENGITGDVDFEAVKEKAAAITPVPGGVGSLTTTIIMNNVLKAIRLQGLA